ncbi:acyl-CoA thioesterase [Sphingomonas echinoides]|uniref:Thioesterase family protein n=1 Tax=Sphingomonas echinoides TaxID=59803 RepID=A0ABU4PLR5_9SPHN|nr:thioesterase family protein [Sphingomonas echinoides]MDX5985123.1 thioesterase family protein [Sphingomonas echinoides]
MADGDRLAGLPAIEEFPSVIAERVRFSDTDRQGHVNNLQFGAFLEAGRAHVLFGEGDLSTPGCFFVIARTSIEFVGELTWPGEVHVANRIDRIGTSSIRFAQALFQNARCAATSESVMVQVNVDSREAAPLSDRARASLSALARPGS